MSIFDIFKPKRWKAGKLVIKKFTVTCNQCGKGRYHVNVTIPDRFEEPCLEMQCTHCGCGEIVSP